MVLWFWWFDSVGVSGGFFGSVDFVVLVGIVMVVV